MKKLQRSFRDVKALAVTAHTFVRDTTTGLAENQIEHLRAQLDSLWKMAEDVLPASPSHLLDSVDRMLDDVCQWHRLGWPGEFVAVPVR